jgi:hypothetical protein
LYHVSSVAHLPASNFCQQFDLGRTSDFHISAYGEDLAHTLASAWMHKVSFFWDAWVDAGRPDDMLWPPVVAGYEEPAAFRAIVDAGASVALQRRLQRIRGLVPRTHE